jgi:uncharacterized protein YbaR (Trm112 family)
MKTTSANTLIEVVCVCPYCKSFLDILDEPGVKKSMDCDNKAQNCNLEIKCSECEETFIVTDIKN